VAQVERVALVTLVEAAPGSARVSFSSVSFRLKFTFPPRLVAFASRSRRQITTTSLDVGKIAEYPAFRASVTRRP
jgi:hypothetical protein